MKKTTGGNEQDGVDAAHVQSDVGARVTPTDPITVAREYGIDISLLQSNLLRTPEERIRLASAALEFIKRIRGQAGRGPPSGSMQ